MSNYTTGKPTRAHHPGHHGTLLLGGAGGTTLVVLVPDSYLVLLSLFNRLMLISKCWEHQVHIIFIYI
jgi:hypothetical protein